MHFGRKNYGINFGVWNTMGSPDLLIYKACNGLVPGYIPAQDHSAQSQIRW